MSFLPSMLLTLSTLMANLLTEGATEQESRSPFFRMLSEVANANHWPQQVHYCDDGIVACHGRAVAIGDEVVVLLKKDAFARPGGDSVRLFLIDAQGSLLDAIACSVSIRWGVLAAGAQNGEFIVNIHGHWPPPLDIYHGSQTWEFRADDPVSATAYRSPVTGERDLEAPSNVYLEMRSPPDVRRVDKVVMRVGVANGHFAVRFPSLSGPPTLNELAPIAEQLAQLFLSASGNIEIEASRFASFELQADGTVKDLLVSDDPHLFSALPSERAQFGGRRDAQLNALKRMIQRQAPFMKLPAGGPSTAVVNVTFGHERPEKH
jgi:hypothetical protein